ncbi:response regulator [Actinomyces howellii]|uniref:Transcriptional regulatory protein devR (DosR) n=1 Tax=Actinomyces howellii TaxID=52771 RepID=A0A3S4SPM9_9ACTO|nr:response regulator transcription factor [Actinomyces howellii]VEG30144.1 Transcriptional regulatory protein devR (dosR) [Actinomyces howellii]
MTAPIRVLLVDDQALVRHGLRRLLELENEVLVVGEAGDGAEALELVRGGLEVDIALVDARMPVMDGPTLVARLCAEHPEVSTLLLTTFDEDELVLSSLAAGAGGFLLKDVEPEDLVQAIRSVRARTMVIDEHVAPRLVARITQDPPAVGRRPVLTSPAGPPGAPELTPRELEIAGMVAQGASNREIAEALYLTEGTVKNHVSSALRKLGLRDRTQLALALRR